MMYTGQMKGTGGTITLGGAIMPVFTDWDNDGDTDLIAGCADGSIQYFCNWGTEESPEFTYSTRMYAESREIRISNPAPAVADMDADGMRDLVLGDGSGNVHLLRNIGTNYDPYLAVPVKLQTTAGDMKVTGPARPFAVDWDEDGDTDLLVGDRDGQIMLFENPACETPVPSHRAAAPDDFLIITCFPNPFNESTTLRFVLDRPGPVSISVFNAAGQLIDVIFQDFCGSGAHSVRWDTHRLPGGLYLCRMMTDRAYRTVKMIVQK